MKWKLIKQMFSECINNITLLNKDYTNIQCLP